MISAVALLACTFLGAASTQAMFVPPFPPRQLKMDANCPVDAPPMQDFNPAQMFTGSWFFVDGKPVPSDILCDSLNFTSYDTNSNTAHVNFTSISDDFNNVTYLLDLVQASNSNTGVYNVVSDTGIPYQITIMYTDYTSVCVLAQCMPNVGQFVLVLSRTASQPANIDVIKQKLAAVGFPTDDAHFGPHLTTAC